MNSDPFNTDHSPPAAPEEPAPTRRRGTRRTASRATPPAPDHGAPSDVTGAAESESATPATTTTTRGTRRSRGRAATAATPVVEGPAQPAEEVATPAAGTDETTAAPSIDEIIVPLSAGDALVSEATGSQVAGEEPLTRTRRRRRGRSTRAAEVEEPQAADATVESALEAVVEAVPEPSQAELEPLPAMEAQQQAEAPVTGRRRRRRGRGGRNGAVDEAALEDAAELPVGIPADLAEPDLSQPEPEEEAALSPTILRRFDHRDWRDRPGRMAAAVRSAPVHREVPTIEPTTPVPFERPGRPQRGERQPARFAREAPAPIMPQSVPAAQSAAPPVTPSPIVMPAPQAPPAAPALPRTIPSGGSLEERLERLITAQEAVVQQQHQALQAMTATMAALQGTIERMTTRGIAAGMPRAGIFVDAPNVIYAAESARINLDYGRMLDFLGRGREMVHAIVYAPVTEESGYRFEGQRFVAPFLRKGYKLVTKPLKRFPDGTAKGNFDIELAIDIVTMSQRLDVVILISGDSDFSRLIELIQSRGVRVEVVAFASNVSWELVQMADVFIDIGEYLHEFRAQ